MYSLLSDIHLERNVLKNVVKNMLDNVSDARALILAGDIVTFTSKNKLSTFFKEIRPYYLNIYYVLGNHEYIGSNIIDYEYVKESYKEICQETGVCLLENNFVKNPHKIYGTTLWSNPYKNVERPVEKIIRKSIIHDMHKRALDNIVHHNDIDILVTHHLPSFALINKKYKNNKNKHLYASNSDHLIQQTKIFAHGHTHTRLDITRNSVRIICNPYVNDEYYRPLDF